MSDWHEDRERLAAQVEDILAGWHESVERVPGEDGEADTIVARDGDRVAAILPLDDESVEAMVDAEGEGELHRWLRDELAEDADQDEVDDDEGDDDLEAAADAWLGQDDEEDAADDGSDDDGSEDDEDDDDFDLDDWDDPEADALIDELPA